MTISGDFERFKYVNFETSFLKKENPFRKTAVLKLRTERFNVQTNRIGGKK